MASNGNYGSCSNLKLSGGIIDPNQYQVAFGIVGLVYVDGLTIDGVTVKHNLPSGHADWALAIGGRNGLVTRCQILDGDETFEDGIHLIHGQDWRISDNYVESGDDAIALGPSFTDPRLQAHPDPIRRVTVTNNVVNAQKAYGLSIFAESGATGTSWEVTDVTVQGLVGQAGVLANGGIRVIDQNLSAAGTSQVRRIKIRGVTLAVGSTAHDDVGDPVGVLLSSVSDVEVHGVALTITDKTAASTGFIGCEIANSEDVTVNRLSCRALGKRYGVTVGSSFRVKIENCYLRSTSASSEAGIWFSQVRDMRITGRKPKAGAGLIVPTTA